MPKFQAGSFLRKRGDCCNAIQITEVLSDTGLVAAVVAVWYVKLGNGWRRVSNPYQFKINQRDYFLWRVFEPREGSIE